MATKPTKTKRAAPRKRRKPPASGKPKRHPWTREDGEIHGPGYKIGYARVSTLDQNLALQQDALKEAGCEKIFIEQMSGAASDRPAPRETLDYARSGDTLIVRTLDRLAIPAYSATIHKSQGSEHPAVIGLALSRFCL